MGTRELTDQAMAGVGEALAPEASAEWEQLLAAPTHAARVVALPSVVVGELIAIADEGRTPLVTYPGLRAGKAVRARTVVDLHGPHIGLAVTLAFEEGDAARPIVTGVVRPSVGWPLSDKPAQVEVDIDGERMIVSAKEQLVLRCGKASITLTKAGKVLIEGSYVSSRSSGVNRIRGGSVQLN